MNFFASPDVGGLQTPISAWHVCSQALLVFIRIADLHFAVPL